ncbi:hypothetical protein J6590_061379, partial [Homalodisca vitripennis]
MCRRGACGHFTRQHVSSRTTLLDALTLPLGFAQLGNTVEKVLTRAARYYRLSVICACAAEARAGTSHANT